MVEKLSILCVCILYVLVDQGSCGILALFNCTICKGEKASFKYQHIWITFSSSTMHKTFTS